MEMEEQIIPSKVNFIFYGVSHEDALLGQDIIRGFGKNGAAAFRSLLDAYLSERNYAQLLLKIDELEQRIQEMEHKDEQVTKTFGGHSIGKIREIRSEEREN